MVRTTKVALVFTLAMMLTVFGVSLVSAADPITADLYDVQGRVVGSATLTPMDDGMTEVVVKVSGMQPVGGDRRLAIAGVGMCEGDFSSAGSDTQALPNVQFYASGGADYKVNVESVNLDALADANGSALVIYADAGEEAGARIICGVLSATTAPSDDSDTPAPEPEASPEASPETAPAPAPAPAATPEAAASPEADADEGVTLEEALNAGYGTILYDVQGRTVGLMLMLEDNAGDALVVGFVEGMVPGPSKDHRIALTNTGTCEGPDFTSAGDEVAALPNIQFYSSGSADYGEVIEEYDLDTLADENGSAVVIYADSGEEPGARIICGRVISASETLGYFGATVEDFVSFVEALAS